MEIKEIKKILRENRTIPSKRLGQNFLIGEKIILKIIEAADLSKNDLILEIGPGIGNLTSELAKRAKRVVAIEKDPKMIEILKKVLKNFDNIKIIQGDIRKIPLNKGGAITSLLSGNYKVVANLPFYLTQPVIRKFLEAEVKPQEMILMVQKEVAQRICAQPPKMNLLAISVQFYAKPKIIRYVSKESFWPKPEVDGAILKILTFNRPRKPAFDQEFFKIARASFSHPRKQIINNLAFAFKIDKMKIRNWLLKNNIQPKKRAENLSLEDLTNLTNNSILK